jgi:hypothetical protein
VDRLLAAWDHEATLFACVAGVPMLIRSGHITAFYLFDIADEVDLAAVPRLLETPAAPARLAPKPQTPQSVRYQTPPLVIDGDALGLPALKGCQPRLKVFDYGVISLALMLPVNGSWADLHAATQRLTSLDGQAQEWAEQIVQRLRACLVRSHPPSLSEDYLTYAITDLAEPMSADTMVEQHGDAIAALLRGEGQPLSKQERDEVLRHRISYLVDDLVVPTWNAALVYDTEAGAQAALEIFEFANSQLLEFRYYDDLLESELTRIYDTLQEPRWYDALGPRYVRAAQRLHALFIDVNELADKTENALKMVGDVYAARLYALVAARLGLDRWKQNVEEKLDTLDDIYRFTVEQTQMSRAHLLELTIILILVLELVLVFMGIMK